MSPGTSRPQRLSGGFGRGEVQRGEAADDLAIDLFGPGMVDVAAPQACLDVRDRNLAVVGGKRAGHRGRGVALDHHPVGPLFVEHFADAGEQASGERIERLIGPHQVEIVIGADAGNLQHLVNVGADETTNGGAKFSFVSDGAAVDRPCDTFQAAAMSRKLRSMR